MEGDPFLVVGNPTIDLNVVFGRAGGPRLGGTGAISSLSLAGFGDRVVMAGRIGPDFGPLLDPVRAAGVEVFPLEAPATLRFENVYPDPLRPERREQRAQEVPPPLSAADLRPLLGRRFAGALLGPLTPGDLSLDLVQAVREAGAPVAMDVQGFLREVGDGGAVRPRPWPDAAAYLRGLSLLHAGDDEAAALLGEPAAGAESARRLARKFEVEAVAVTWGGDGAWVFSRQEGLERIPAFHPGPLLLDPTGCGDIFLAAFFHGRLAGWPLRKAGRFASMAAALNAYSQTLRCAPAAEVERALAAAAAQAGGSRPDGRTGPP